MDDQTLKRIAVRIAEGKSSIDELLSQADQQGWKSINGILEIGGSIYQAISLSKNPNAWQVYKGHRNLEESDSYVLYWFFNDEASSQNNAGEFIYDSEDPNEINTSKFEPYDSGSVESDIRGSKIESDTVARIQKILSGEFPDRWEGAERL